MKVISRNGNSVDFDSNRIFRAIKKAFYACEYEIDDATIWEIVNEIPVWEDISVEDIQDEVEETLMNYGYTNVAKEYILYRRERAIIRAQKDGLIKNITAKLEAKNVQNQNANVDEQSFGGRLGEASRVVTKDYALNYCMSGIAKDNHLNNEIYIHDLDSYAIGMHNCLSIPFDDLLKNGFNTRQTDVRPANSINTAFQLVAVLFQIQSLQQFGGVSATHLDWTMVPYIRKSFMKHYLYEYIKANCDVDEEFILNSGWDEFSEWIDEKKEYYLNKLGLLVKDFYVGNSKLKNLSPGFYNGALIETRKELNQAVEGMYHNLNTLQSRSGN